MSNRTLPFQTRMFGLIHTPEDGSSAKAEAMGARPEHHADSGIADHAADAERLRSAIDAHWAFLWRTLRRLGVPERELDDALQRVYLVAARQLGGVNPKAEKSFLFGVALRIAANARRTERRQREVLLPAPCDGMVSETAAPDRSLEEQDMRLLLDRALDQLSEELRTVLVLSEIEELPAAEIAELLDIPIGTVASRLRRARERFFEVAARLRSHEQEFGRAR